MEKFRLHRKASCRCLNQNNVTLHGAYHIYPEGRHCKVCGHKLSIYNGMKECNACWMKENLPNLEDKVYQDIEAMFLNRMAGVR